ncbi:hypothetical protein ACQUKH_20795, partial [Ralstonia pseudosolanacearum]
NVSATTTNITNLQNTIKNISGGSAGLVQQSAAGKDITVAKDLDGDAVDFSGKKLSDSTTFSRKLTGVAEGTLSATSTDAVSGKQLYATNQNVSKLSANVTDVSDSVTNIKNTMNTIVNGGGLKYFHANSTLDDAQAMGLESIAFGGAAVAAGMNSMAMGGNARAVAGNAVALGAGSVADRANTVSVGSAGKERQITNVAAGTADTDAVNVAQLKAAGIINGSGRTNATVTYGTNADGSADYGNVTLGGGNAPAGTAIHTGRCTCSFWTWRGNTAPPSITSRRCSAATTCAHGGCACRSTCAMRPARWSLSGARGSRAARQTGSARCRCIRR